MLEIKDLKVYIQAFQGKPWNEECDSAYNGFKQLGFQVELFTTTEQLKNMERSDLVVGGMLIMEHVLNDAEIKLEPVDYPEEIFKYCGRKIWVTSICKLRNYPLPLFIKPVKEKKAKGIIINNWEDLKEFDHLNSNELVYCSEVVNFISEWRCFVRYRKLLGVQNYFGDSEKKPDLSIVSAAIADYDSMPNSCALDFGVTSDGRTLLIEVNDGFAIGSYNLPDEKYAMFLMTRWAQIMNIEDVLANTAK
ncbi:ATP-grasp domain-containing protein [Ignavigranum ruoffiae]|uniref:ATP-grasp domain-containing protein n=1 Tax=Ignavigranum ruoffiae TaxID=89093 RepID=UPI0020460C7B|nr:ATP-grasp domain-containing protein [Ignavigranum ruoffiae]UPQ85940.1 ATP-grasp domain-containing protein [Ignavigranum ruoffiae]